jgi:phosphoglycolate phosphatase
MGDRHGVRLFITDLDNTLYDWLGAFVPALYEMVRVAAEILSVDQEQLLDDLQRVHRRYHNSEQPFALLETSSAKERYPLATRFERAQYLDRAFHAFNSLRKRNLRLYPGVRETLAAIRRGGCPVVAYTESVVENSLYRLHLLGLTDLINYLYAPRSLAEGHPDPTHKNDFDRYLKMVRPLPDGHRKPDASVLADICAQHDVDRGEALYVGDSMTRDVVMAKTAGVKAVWARYGCQHDPVQWGKLERITHWTNEDVIREKNLREAVREIKPDYIINSYPELLEHFHFHSQF